MKDILISKNKEQQFYIETLHKDFENIEKSRVKMYKEEEAERSKLMEDVIKIYEKTKDHDVKIAESDRKIFALKDQILKMKGLTERRALSPQKEEHGCDTTVGTPRRGFDKNGSGERSTLD